MRPQQHVCPQGLGSCPPTEGRGFQPLSTCFLLVPPAAPTLQAQEAIPGGNGASGEGGPGVLTGGRDGVCSAHLPSLMPGPGAVLGARGLPERFPREEEWSTKGQERER